MRPRSTERSITGARPTRPSRATVDHTSLLFPRSSAKTPSEAKALAESADRLAAVIGRSGNPLIDYATRMHAHNPGHADRGSVQENPKLAFRTPPEHAQVLLARRTVTSGASQSMTTDGDTEEAPKPPDADKITRNNDMSLSTAATESSVQGANSITLTNKTFRVLPTTSPLTADDGTNIRTVMPVDTYKNTLRKDLMTSESLAPVALQNHPIHLKFTELLDLIGVKVGPDFDPESVEPSPLPRLDSYHPDCRSETRRKVSLNNSHVHVTLVDIATDAEGPYVIFLRELESRYLIVGAGYTQKSTQYYVGRIAIAPNREDFLVKTIVAKLQESEIETRYIRAEERTKLDDSNVREAIHDLVTGTLTSLRPDFIVGMGKPNIIINLDHNLATNLDRPISVRDTTKLQGILTTEEEQAIVAILEGARQRNFRLFQAAGLDPDSVERRKRELKDKITLRVRANQKYKP